ncbi:MAG TPA: phasin family protein [Thermoanaerobaculia bacterium]|nr:phasin family protein [Thermoanaerobaculia bacterium]
MSQAQTRIDAGFGKLLNAGRNLWLAGLGAVAGVEEGSRELFDRLIERGRPVEERQKKVVNEVADRTNRTVAELKKLLQDQVAWESRGVLKKLNLMTVEDVKILSARLDTLSRKLDEYAVLKAAQKPAAPEVVETEIIILTDAPEASRSR